MKVRIRRLFVIVCYAPFFDENSNVNDIFWGSLNDILGNSNSREKIILLGDMNGWVLVKLKCTDRVLGHFSDAKNER